MEKIKAVPYEGERLAKTCSVTGKPFHLNEGLAFSLDGKPVSPETANRAGFVIHEDVKPPPDVKTKVELGDWLTGIGIKRGSDNYLEMYLQYSPLYPLK